MRKYKENKNSFSSEIAEVVEEQEEKDWSIIKELQKDFPKWFTLVYPTHPCYGYDGITINFTGGTSAIENKWREKVYSDLYIEPKKWNKAVDLNEKGVKFLYVNVIGEGKLVYIHILSRVAEDRVVFHPNVKIWNKYKNKFEFQDRLGLYVEDAWKFEKIDGIWKMTPPTSTIAEYTPAVRFKGLNPQVNYEKTKKEFEEFMKNKEYIKWLN